MCRAREDVDKLKKSLNDLEQYGRRQSICLNNVSLGNDEEYESKVLEILNKALPVDENIVSYDVERCHRKVKQEKQ